MSPVQTPKLPHLIWMISNTVSFHLCGRSQSCDLWKAQIYCNIHIISPASPHLKAFLFSTAYRTKLKLSTGGILQSGASSWHSACCHVLSSPVLGLHKPSFMVLASTGHLPGFSSGWATSHRKPSPILSVPWGPTLLYLMILPSTLKGDCHGNCMLYYGL